MAWNPAPEIAAARDFGAKFETDQVVILYVLRDGRSAAASWGKTRHLCDRTRSLADVVFGPFQDAVAVQRAAARRAVEIKSLRLPEPQMFELWDELQFWSESTFGRDQSRGPSGPCKHLRKEADEVLAAIERIRGYLGEDGRIPKLKDLPVAGGLTSLVVDLHYELADCLILVMDMARRAGMSLDELIQRAADKHKLNTQRQWPQPGPDRGYWDAEAVEHQR